MPLRWQCCPHCKVFFMPQEESERTGCPACGKLLAGVLSPAAVPPTSGAARPAWAFDSVHQILSEAQVVPEAANCVQCGICSYNCPMGIDVRSHAWRGSPIRDSHCLTCSECVKRCPRGVLRFERIPLLTLK